MQLALRTTSPSVPKEQMCSGISALHEARNSKDINNVTKAFFIFTSSFPVVYGVLKLLYNKKLVLSISGTDREILACIFKFPETATPSGVFAFLVEGKE
jgi:hypothetical protein